MRLAIDGMGGDEAPSVIVEGVINAAQSLPYELIIVGDQDIIRTELNKHKVNVETLSRITIYHASQAISMSESPGRACRTKKDSSIMIATRLVADGLADAVISAGNSGAAMTAALMLLRRLKHVQRPGIATLLPTLEGLCVVLDVGANVDCRPKNLFQFAVMGSVYIKYMFDKEYPRVGLLSIGEEESKGNELTLSTFKLLKTSNLNFIGNIEGNDVPKGKTDVVVCDGFVGNVLLKFGEGVANIIFRLIHEKVKANPIRTTLTGLLLKNVFRDIKKRVDYDEYGGAPLLGVNGTCFICHGRSNAKAIKNAIRHAAEFVDKKINQAINWEIEKNEELLNGYAESENKPAETQDIKNEIG